MLRVDAHPDRSRGEDFEPLDEERRLQSIEKVIDDRGKVVLALERVKQQQKLVPADACQQVGGANIVRDPLRYLDEQPVADRVTVIVVDVLEIVDVEEGERES